MTYVLAALALAISQPTSLTELHHVNMGAGEMPLGTFCRIQAVCVLAQTETDCSALGGKTFDTLEACRVVPTGAEDKSK